MSQNDPYRTSAIRQGGEFSHPHGVTGCPSTVGEFCARGLIKWDFPLVTEREEFVRAMTTGIKMVPSIFEACGSQHKVA